MRSLGTISRIRTGSCCLRTLPYSQEEGSVARAWVSNNDSCFSCPEETSRNTTNSTTKEHKPRVGGDVVRVQSSSIKRISNGAKCKSIFESDAIVDSSSCYANNEEKAIYQCIGSGDSIWFRSSSSSKSTKSIPHTRRCERDTACYDDLERHRSKERLAFGDERARGLRCGGRHGDVDIFALTKQKPKKTGREDVGDVDTSRDPVIYILSSSRANFGTSD